MRLPREEARREAIKIKGVYYASFLGTSKVYQHFKPVKNEDVISAHGYVYTYPGSFCAFIGMGWVWGIIHIGVGFCNTHSLVKELVPPRCANGSNGTDTHPFLFHPSHRGIGDTDLPP